jgi:hypothetical protein
LTVVGSPANEVETGNRPKSGNSDVFAVFYVEINPGSTQLFRLLRGITWISNGGSFNTATAAFDNDGNAVFAFSGSGCAAGPRS